MQLLFGNCALDIGRRELARGTELIEVAPKVFDLLVYLVQNRERVVTKDELFEALWSERIVSDSTLTTHINAARKAIGDTGKEQNVIRTVARKGFRFVGEIKTKESPIDISTSIHATTNASEQAMQARPAPTLSDRPSIAVLPFQNRSDDPEQEYFADGIVDDIITGLSRMRWLFVIARNSSFTYKGRTIDTMQVGRELGVRYVLEGSVRKAASRARITGELVDASNGVNLWSDRFESALEDIFSLQDQITTSVLGAIAPKLEQAEIERARRKPTESLDAYDYFLRGMANFYLPTRDTISEALSLFGKAIELDPHFASAYGAASYCYVYRKINNWMIDPAKEIVETERLARRAMELGTDDAVALARAASALAYVVGDVDLAKTFVDHARGLNPNLAVVWMASGWTRIWLGETETAIEHFAQAMRLSPLDPQMFGMQSGIAHAHFFAGRYDEAASWAQRASSPQANYLSAMRVAAASNALAGRLTQARKIMSRIREHDPTSRVSHLGNRLPLCQPEDLAKYEEGLRLAGLPE